jgi:hypothetical protein
MLIYSAAHSEMLNAFYKETTRSTAQTSHPTFQPCEAHETKPREVIPSDEDRDCRSELDEDEDPWFGHRVMYVLRLARLETLPMEKTRLVEASLAVQ